MERWLSPAPSKITLHPSALSPQGPGTKPPTVKLRRPNSFPYIHKHIHTKAHTLAFSTEHIQIPLIHIQEDQELCSECITWDLVFTRYPFALKGFCGLIFFYSVTPGNFICRYIFHIIFCHFFVLFISFKNIFFHFHDGPLQTKKATYFRGHT